MYEGGSKYTESDEECTSEENNKKRQGSPSIFKTSALIKRTPSKKGENFRDMEDLKEMMKQLLLDVKEIKQDQKESRENVKEMRREIRELRDEQRKDRDIIRKLEDQNNSLVARVNAVQEETKKLQREFDMLDKEKRKNRLVMSGMAVDTEDKGTIKEASEKVMRDFLNIDIKIGEVTKINNNMVIMEMRSFEDKVMILKNKYKLKSVQQVRIFINNDETKEERRIQKLLRDKASEQRKEGKNVKVGYQKITINGELWRWNPQQETLNKVNQAKN